MSPTGTAQLALALAEHTDLHDEHGMEGDDRGMYDERERDESNEHGEAKCSGPRRAVIEAALARRLRHEMEAAHTESTLFARRRRLRGWSLYRRQTTELPRAGPAVCPARHCTRRGSCSGSIDPSRRA